MERKVLFVALFVGLVFLFSCSKKPDFYDLYLMNETKETREEGKAYLKAYKKLNKKEQEQYHDFINNLSSKDGIEDFYEVIVERHPALFHNYEFYLKTFLEIIETQNKNKETETNNRIQGFQNRIKNTRNNRDYLTAKSDYHLYLTRNRTNIDSVKNISELKVIQEKMTRLERKRMDLTLAGFTNEKDQKLWDEYNNFIAEIETEKKAVEEERQRQLEIARQTTRENQERINREKERRGGVERSYSLSIYDQRSGVSVARNTRTFYLMKDGSGTFDSNFIIDRYVNKENIVFDRLPNLANPIIRINGTIYVIVN